MLKSQLTLPPLHMNCSLYRYRQMKLPCYIYERVKRAGQMTNKNRKISMSVSLVFGKESNILKLY